MEPFIEVGSNEDLFFIQVNEDKNISIKPVKKAEKGSVMSAADKAAVSLEKLTKPSLLTDIGKCIKRVSDTIKQGITEGNSQTSVKEIEVEFAISVKSGGTIVVVDVEGSASFKVTAKIVL
ncbi:CU044_2847 family protein [Dyadobacter sp. BHUBP1]|uniref:CU044_2847 family protein n=1 Tax=Dyadobacter sp. BHUBP1 TaxID=3424178 RepID=UPI003D32C3FA